MESLQCYQSSHKAHRSHLTRAYSKVKDIMESEEAQNESQLATLNTALEKLQRKKQVLQDLDRKISEAIQDPEELEGDVLEAEEIQDSILEIVDEFTQFLSQQAKLSAAPPRSTQTEPTVSSNLSATAQPYQPRSMEQTGSLEDSQVPHPSQSQSADSLLLEQSSSSHGGLNASQSASRLPTFTGMADLLGLFSCSC